VRAAGVLAAAVLIGCGPGKELPDTVPEARTSRPGPDGTGPKAAAPTESDPVARAVIDRAVAAVTKNDPGKLARAKVSRVLTTGGCYLRPDAPPADASRRIEAVWPDRVRAAYEFKDPALGTQTYVFRRPNGWLVRADGELGPGNPAEVGGMLGVDFVGQHWLYLGLPFADPRGVAYDPRKVTGTRPVTTVKLALPDLPVFLLTFDDDSGLLTRVEYTATEFGRAVRKVLALSGHKEAGGLVLPFGIDLIQNGLPAERWAVTGWEFPDAIDDAAFDLPK
jgi:hypothetical protein